jgi:hypothetical protein
MKLYPLLTKSLAIILLQLGMAQAMAETCAPGLNLSNENFPECPKSNYLSLVPENYPLGAVVVSDTGMMGRDPEFTVDLVTKILAGAGKDTPLILLPVEPSTVEKIRDKIDSMQVSAETKEKWKASLRAVQTPSFLWQQDYMQAFVNPQTGKVVLREIDGYTEQDKFKAALGAVDKIAAVTKDCGVEKGDELTNKIIFSGVMGGNIETLPGGVCLLGTDGFPKNSGEFQMYFNQLCPDPSAKIGVPTSWLTVGHTDEVLKVIRNKQRSAPCDFSIAVASPRLALDLLAKKPGDKFFNFRTRDSNQRKSLVSERIESSAALSKLCRSFYKLNSVRREIPSIQRKPIKGVSFFNIFEITAAFAGLPQMNAEYGQPLDATCAGMTNGQALRALREDAELWDYNLLVQKEMDKLKASVSWQMKQKFPNCEPDLLDVPDLFAGGSVVRKRQSMELPRGSGDSLLPNPTNALSANETLISPEPGNDVFRSYLEEQYTARGLKAEFVDTFDYAHIGSGNLHCSTNTIHLCRPRKKP